MGEDLPGEMKTVDIAKEVSDAEPLESDEEVILARDLMGSFIKAIKAYRFYPPANPTVKGFQESLLRKLQFFLNKYDSFVIQIGEFDLSFAGKVLYENRDVKTSLAFLFYKDGLRELRFLKGIEEWEIQGLLEIIKRSDNINQLEDDLVTLLWEKDFVHISYLATDEFLEESPIIVPESLEQFRKNLVFTPLAHNVEIDQGEDESDEGITIEEILQGRVKDRALLPQDRNVYFLTAEELDSLRKEIETETEPSFVFNMADILFEILALEKEREPFEDATNVLDNILDALITLGDFQKAADVLKRLYLVQKIYDLRDWQIDLVRRLIEKAGEPGRIERIGRVLEREEEVRLEDLSSYLSLLQRNSVKPLIELLGQLKNSKVRRVVCDAVSEISKNSVDQIAPFIDDRRWYLVRNVTYILGRIGTEQSLPHIQKALQHEDFRVRREAVQALGMIGTPKATALLIRGLTDRDARIRSLSAINLGRAGKAAAVAPLLQVIQSKDFHKRDPQEIKAFFDAVGMAGSNEAVPVLQEILERKSWLGRGTTDAMRIGAASALATIGTPEAKKILEGARGSKDASVRTACIQALSSTSLRTG